ncbi:hypothetical protein WICPIJ_008514, partial [Wickerhamomyces pijperi]
CNNSINSNHKLGAMSSRRNSYSHSTAISDSDSETSPSNELFPQVLSFSNPVQEPHVSNDTDAATNLNQRRRSSAATGQAQANTFAQQHRVSESSLSPFLSDANIDQSSITNSQLQTHLTNLPPQAWDNKTHEKFFFTKMLNILPPESDLSDFATYDLMVRREAELEERANQILEEQQETYMKVGTELEGLELQYEAGDEQKQIEKNAASRSRFGKRFITESIGLNPESTVKISKLIKKPFKGHHQQQKLNEKLNEKKKQSIRKNELYALMSNNTDVIDISRNELAKNLFNLDPESTRDPTSMEKNPLSTENGNAKYHLQRKLEKHQIQMIALGGTLGVGLFLSSGKAFSIAGPLGCLLGFVLSGSIVLATMLSFAEMSTLIPTTSSISGLASRFVEDAFGFALGWCYWLSFTIAMPGEVCAGVIMLSYFDELKIPGLSSIGFVSLFLTFIIGVNLFDVRIYGNVEFVFSFFKVMVTVVLIITMLVVNVKQKYGFKYWRPSMSTQWETYGPFRPSFDLEDIGDGALNGIRGATGRFLQVLSAILISSYAFSGSEIGFIAAMECKNPRKALPSVTKRVFGRVTILYLLSIFMVGLDVYSGDPRLLRYYAPADSEADISDALPQGLLAELSAKCPVRIGLSHPNGNQSPWIIALQTAGYCSFGTVLNAMLILFATSAGSSHLFYFGLKYRPDIIARDDPSYPYRSPFQPYLAMYGLVGSLFIALSMGFVIVLPGRWSVKTFFTSYGGIIIFAGCYCGYKFSSRSSRIQRLDQLDLDSGRREIDRMIWDEEKDFKAGASLWDITKRVLGWLT